MASHLNKGPIKIYLILVFSYVADGDRQQEHKYLFGFRRDASAFPPGLVLSHLSQGYAWNLLLFLTSCAQWRHFFLIFAKAFCGIATLCLQAFWILHCTYSRQFVGLCCPPDWDSNPCYPTYRLNMLRDLGTNHLTSPHLKSPHL